MLKKCHLFCMHLLWCLSADLAISRQAWLSQEEYRKYLQYYDSGDLQANTHTCTATTTAAKALFSVIVNGVRWYMCSGTRTRTHTCTYISKNILLTTLYSVYISYIIYYVVYIIHYILHTIYYIRYKYSIWILLKYSRELEVSIEYIVYHVLNRCIMY